MATFGNGYSDFMCCSNFGMLKIDERHGRVGCRTSNLQRSFAPLRSENARKFNSLRSGPRIFCSSVPMSQVERADSYFLSDSRPIILFDGVCNLCNGGVNMVLDNDPKETMRFAALQSDAGKALLIRSGRSPDDISSIVLIEKDRSYIKSEAVLRIADYLRVPFPIIAAMLTPFPLFLRDVVYDTVASNRYNIFGKTSTCRLSDRSYKDRFIEQ
ncbi:hypothetical protein KP509_23G049800 [Ceratopteris richardii]|uniref:Thiol-disulfide oxidoreductase DCC n=1 Tax=Ceratopteris richardii TaxID=49495 RepID=A0A8T2S090_CERRI|nr:hypothetical protein KP509_23G049800 [Ceratopteris richardii]